jgi:proteasome accessory factor C
MTTSAEQVTRLLSLVPYLQRHPDADLAATAATFGVTAEQLVEDLNVLWYCGLPGGLPGDLIEIDMDALEGSGRIRLTNADYLARPMRFTPDEALSLVVALRAVRELTGPSNVDGVDKALAKLEAATPAADAAPQVAVVSGDEQVRAALAAAIEARSLVAFDYIDSGLESSTPKVAPVKLLSRDGYGYLQAWSLDRLDWRTYRLDRIRGVREAKGRRPRLGEPPFFGAGWLDSRPEAATVTLRLAPGAAWITEYYPMLAVRPQADAVEVDLLVADPAWLRSLLLRLGSGVLDVIPPEAAADARQAAADALAAYRTRLQP